jgi:hypothetical protein
MLTISLEDHAYVLATYLAPDYQLILYQYTKSLPVEHGHRPGGVLDSTKEGSAEASWSAFGIGKNTDYQLK